MPDWIKRGACEGVKDFFAQQTGLPAEQLLPPQLSAPGEIYGVPSISKMLLKYLHKGTTITVVSSSDADGLNAAAILCKTLAHLSRSFGFVGAEPVLVVGKPQSGDPGFAELTSTQVPDGGIVILTNLGMCIPKTVRRLREKDCAVIILDSHKPEDTYKLCTRFIINQWLNEDEKAFREYSTSGLAFQLANSLLFRPGRVRPKALRETEERLLCDNLFHAAVGTIIAKAPLVLDNRRIVKRAIRAINFDVKKMSAFPAVARKYGFNDKFVDASDLKRLGKLINVAANTQSIGGEVILWAMLSSDPQAIEAVLAAANAKQEELSAELKQTKRPQSASAPTADHAQEAVAQPKRHQENYDLEVPMSELWDFINEYKDYFPFGTGFYPPVIRIADFPCTEPAQDKRFFGKRQQHLSLSVRCEAESDEAQNIIFATGYDLAQKYKDLGCPDKVDILCKVDRSVYHSRMFYSLRLINLKTAGKAA